MTNLTPFGVQNSLIFVSHLHSVWMHADNSKKPSKRYGRLIRSEKKGLNEMLLAHMGHVTERMLGRVGSGEGTG